MDTAERKNDRLSEEELKQLFSAPDLDTIVGIRNVTIMLLMVECGLKVGEIVGKEGASGTAVIGGLRVGDVALSEHRLTVVKPKRDTARQVDLSVRVAQYLTIWLAARPDHTDTDLVFTTRRGGPLSNRYVRRFLAEYGRDAGIARPVRPSLLRHTFAHRLFERTHDLDLVQRHMGLRSIAGAARYATTTRKRG